MGRTPRAGARTHAQCDARGRPARGVRAPRVLGESASAFAHRSSLEVWLRVYRLGLCSAPHVPLYRSEPPRTLVVRAPRVGAWTHVERDARGRPARGVRAPRVLGESASAFERHSSWGGWRRFVCFVFRPHPRAPLFRSKDPRRRVGRALRAGARTHDERDARGRPPLARTHARTHARAHAGGGARRAFSVSPRPRSRTALRRGFGVVSFVLSFAPPCARRSLAPRPCAGG